MYHLCYFSCLQKKWSPQKSLEQSDDVRYEASNAGNAVCKIVSYRPSHRAKVPGGLRRRSRNLQACIDLVNSSAQKMAAESYVTTPDWSSGSWPGLVLSDIDQSGWLVEDNSNRKYWCVVADMLFCVFPSVDIGTSPKKVVFLPGVTVRGLVFKSAQREYSHKILNENTSSTTSLR